MKKKFKYEIDRLALDRERALIRIFNALQEASGWKLSYILDNFPSTKQQIQELVAISNEPDHLMVARILDKQYDRAKLASDTAENLYYALYGQYYIGSGRNLPPWE
jgi:hypothetical protein